MYTLPLFNMSTVADVLVLVLKTRLLQRVLDVLGAGN